MYVRDGFPQVVSDQYKCFKARANELSIDRGLLMWGYRIIIPVKFRKQLLQEIRGAHNGIVKMKTIARQYFWWPNLDSNIEDFVKNCKACMENSNNPNKATLIKYPLTAKPFDRIHIDFAGPFLGKMFFIIIDSYSKWPEIYEKSKTDSVSTIEKLKVCFYGSGCRM